MQRATRARWPKQSEWDLAKKVFRRDNLPIKARVFITDGLGLNGSPFTLPTNFGQNQPTGVTLSFMLKPLSEKENSNLSGAERELVDWVFKARLERLAKNSPMPQWAIEPGYVLFVGPKGYKGMDSGMGYWDKPLLVHEMTHVWQGHNSSNPVRYVYRSLVSQAKARVSSGSRNAAYEFRSGRPWKQYNPEEQAEIVERWFENGQKKDANKDALWPYLRDHVRRGKVR